mgnify:CR=1 FL=1
MINMTNVEYIDYFEKIIANEPENILSLYFVQKLMSDVRFRSFQPMISAELQKKILKNKTLPQIAEESEEDTIVIEPIYTLIKENPEAEKEEISTMLNL